MGGLEVKRCTGWSGSGSVTGCSGNVREEGLGWSEVGEVLGVVWRSWSGGDGIEVVEWTGCSGDIVVEVVLCRTWRGEIAVQVMV